VASPQGGLPDAIKSAFGSLCRFQRENSHRPGVGRFGLGLGVVIVKDGKLAIESTPNQDKSFDVRRKSCHGSGCLGAMLII